jgi:hypothetical protein
MTQQELVHEAVRLILENLEKHLYNGICPDDANPYSRDYDCPACQALIELETVPLSKGE